MSSNAFRLFGERLSLLVVVVCLTGLAGVAPVLAAPSSAPALGPSPAGSAVAAKQGSATTTPHMELSLDGHPVHNDSQIVQTDPTLRVNASVGAATPNGTTIKSIVVRINGQTLRSYSPDESPSQVAVELPLDRGNNTVTVIVEDSADNVNSRNIDVAKDDLAPWIGLTSPYSSKLTSSIPNGTVENSLVTLGVRAGDFSALSFGRIDINYTDTYESNYTNQQTDFSKVRSQRIPSPDKQFTRDALLGYGNNTVTISLTDAVGNTRIQQFNLEVVDDQRPDVAIDLYPEQTTDHKIDLSGTISDNVWLRNASIHVVNVDRKEEIDNASAGYKLWNYTKQLKDATPYDYARSGRQLQFNESLLLQQGTSKITIKATDHLGQTVKRTITIERLQSANQAKSQPPNVTLDRNRTRLGPDGRVRLVASISDPDWDIDNIAIETANLSTGKILDFEQYRSLGNRNAVSINTTLRSGHGTGAIVVRARARDRDGHEDVAVKQLARQTTHPSQPVTPDTTTSPPTTTSTTPQPTTKTPSTPVQTTQPPTPTATPTNESAANAGGDSGGFLGNLIGTLVGFVIAILPFVVGGIVFVTVSYFVLRRVREDGGGEAAS